MIRDGVFTAACGVTTVFGSLLMYWALASSVRVLTNSISQVLVSFSYLTLGVMLLGVLVTLYGAWEILSPTQTGTDNLSSVSVVLMKVFGVRKYSWMLLVSAVAYGLFYAVVSSIIIYRPHENFSQEYFAVVPSVVVAVCCGNLGSIPVFTVYLTDHVGLLLIPMNMLILIAVSGLVGLNVALVSYEFENRPRGVGRWWLAGLGAITGLFTACPTCAGLFLGSLIQGVGTVAIASVLAGYQPFFIAIAFPALIASNVLIVRRLKRSFYGSCSLTRQSSSTH